MRQYISVPLVVLVHYGIGNGIEYNRVLSETSVLIVINYDTAFLDLHSVLTVGRVLGGNHYGMGNIIVLGYACGGKIGNVITDYKLFRGTAFGQDIRADLKLGFHTSRADNIELISQHVRLFAAFNLDNAEQKNDYQHNDNGGENAT